MRVPLSWIREFAPVEGTPGAVADALNEIGLIVDAVETPGREVEGVVVARVLGVTEHPKADKLTLVDVDAGSREARVVCGARNLSAGDVVPYAPPGAGLPGGLRLERREIRGEVSDGMLCSARELDLGDDHEGILHLEAGAEPGADVREVLGLDDAVFELDVTPNRPDAMSVVGVARDLAAKLGTDLAVPEPAVSGAGPAASQRCSVEVVDARRCPRYLAMTGTVEPGATSPGWLARRLTLAGMRPLSPVVDVTNYVLLERGQPLHAFDHRRLGGGGIRVRLARDGETMTTLDGVERTFSAEDLLICDTEDAPVAIAGVMGGADSEVGETTDELLLESAYFQPESVLMTSKRLALRTEASARFERGVDPNGIDVAARRAWQLLEEVAGGTAGAGAVDEYPAPIEAERIRLRPRRVNEVLGTALSDEQIAAHLRSVQIDVEPLEDEIPPADGSLTARVPTFRPDVTREIDLVEEVARLYGYNEVARTFPSTGERSGGLSAAQQDRRSVRQALVGAGVSESMAISLVAPSDLERAGHPGVGVEVENPLRVDESLLRPVVLPGVLDAVAFNASHGLPDVRLFEMGTVFLAPRDGELLPDEREHLAVAIAGSERRRPHEDDRPVDVYDAVGVVETVAEALDLADMLLDPAVRPGFHPGRCAAVFVDGVEVGAVGEVAPEVVEAMELPAAVVAAELDLGRMIAGERRVRWFRPPSRFPVSTIDLAFVLPADEPARHVTATLRRAGGELLEEVSVFDVFESAALGAERKSLAFRLRFRAPERTLTDEEVAQARRACVEAVEGSHRGELRG